MERACRTVPCKASHAAYCSYDFQTVNLRLPEALYKQIEDLAKVTERTKSHHTIDGPNGANLKADSVFGRRQHAGTHWPRYVAAYPTA